MDSPTTTATVADLFREAAIANTRAAVAMDGVKNLTDEVETWNAWVSSYAHLQTDDEQEMKESRTRLYNARLGASAAINAARQASARALTAAFNNGV